MRSHRILLLALWAGCAGCSFSLGDPTLATFDPPAEGDSVDPQFWSEAARAEKERGRSTAFWPLPFFVSHDEVQIAPERDRVRHLGISAFNLGLFLWPNLPFWVSVDYGRWTQSGESGHRGFWWTPLWASSSGSGDAPVTLEASGFPLLWGDVEVDSPEDGVKLDLRHYLWSLGPLHIRMELDQAFGGSGWMMYPLYAAGFGGLLWNSHHFGGRNGYETAHGPLGGYLGYHHRQGSPPLLMKDMEDFTDFRNLMSQGSEEGTGATEEAEDPSPELIPHRTLWLGGIGWASFSDKDDTGREINGRHGPLWTLFGYGTDDGEDKIILFGFKI